MGVYEAIWTEGFSDLPNSVLEAAFRKTLRTVKYWPVKVADIREHVSNAEENAANVAAEEAWERVLELRRLYWCPDLPGGFSRGMPKLSERVQQAARAAGVFRDFESTEGLHVWAKKRFIESFIVYGEMKQDAFLLPDGEIKRMLTSFAQAKVLPAPCVEWNELRERGEAYRAETATLRESTAKPTEPLQEIPRVIDCEGRAAELKDQAELIRQKYPTSGKEAAL
jgi:hypothetical protein